MTRLLCNAIDGLRPMYNKPHARRLMEIKNWLRKHGTAVIVVDEAQKLTRGGLYTVEDIIKIVRNNRVKLLTPRAARWLRDLANTVGWGRLGMAMGVLQLAVDMLIPPGGELAQPLDVEDLRGALEQTFGKTICVEIDEAAGGDLLRKVS